MCFVCSVGLMISQALVVDLQSYNTQREIREDLGFQVTGRCRGWVD